MSKTNIQTGIFASLCLAGALLFPDRVWAVNTAAQELILKAYADCKSAHLLRRKDLPQAKLAYENYQKLKAQATDMDISLLDAQDADVDRVLSYCNTVGADIARTEALPVIAQGTVACGEAAKHLRNNNFDSAKLAYSRYLKLKQQAVAISDAILEVFSVKTEVRRCDRISQDIEIANARTMEIKQQLQATSESLEETLRLCQLADASADKVALTQLKKSFKKAQQHSKNRSNISLLENDEIINNGQLDVVTALNKKIETCQLSVQSTIDAKEQKLIEMAQEKETRKQQQLAAKLAEDQLQAKPKETEEQRIKRLSSNYAFYKLVKRVIPKYPREASHYNRVGYVVMEYNIDTNGTVIDPKIIEATPEQIFDDAALTALKKWKYKANFGDAEPGMALARTQIRFTP